MAVLVQGHSTSATAHHSVLAIKAVEAIIHCSLIIISSLLYDYVYTRLRYY